VVSAWTGVPVERMNQDDKERLLTLGDALKVGWCVAGVCKGRGQGRFDCWAAWLALADAWKGGEGALPVGTKAIWNNCLCSNRWLA